MWGFKKPTQEQISDLLIDQRNSNFTYPLVKGTLDYQTKAEFQRDERYKEYNVDQHRIKLGVGPETYRRAIDALCNWKPFALEWVELCYPCPIEVGAVVAVCAYALGVWTVSACRIVYVVNEQDETHPIKRFGFGYGTLEKHVAKGEERFIVEWNTVTNEVFYEILSFSQPGTYYTKLGYPVTRWVQDSFGVSSLTAVSDFVNGKTVSKTEIIDFILAFIRMRKKYKQKRPKLI